MTQDEYERRKQRLAKELQDGMEMLEAAHRCQLRALELVWAATGGDGMAILTSVMTPAAPPEPAAPVPAAPSRPARRKAGELIEGVRIALTQVPEVFDRNDICQALGYDPDRGSLYRVFRELQAEGSMVVESDGSGSAPTVYKKTGM
ncbi:MAG TPA: hypothetical protein VLX28_27345 [Thermoanaerobaculia bacterium]|nr:hypothetical protein [Thermoanaerobaculia bacterium]